MTATKNIASSLRPALERLARKWTLALPGGTPNRYHFFGEELTELLNSTQEPYLDVAAETLADNWGNNGVGVPEGHADVKGRFALDVKQAVANSRGV